ncbi:hypothetical protein ABZ614_41775 [Streptomyces sp. NPDC013178]|uniref:SDR family oxidoreductase n=1 Tax=Streptomyces sp. NPDC013178 TaxID=3155118 RepID=UPI0033F43C46
MKVVVVGGTGPVGAHTVTAVRDRGHEAVLLPLPRRANALLDGRGPALPEVLEGASVVIDLSGPPDQAAGLFSGTEGFLPDEDTVRDCLCRPTVELLAAENAADIGHHVALSVVGVDSLQDGTYFRVLRERDELLRRSGVPYSLIRATQLFESVRSIADTSAEDWAVWLPPVEVRPVAAAEAAALIARTALSAPLHGVREIAGPDRFPLDVFVRVALTGGAERPHVFADADGQYFGARLAGDALLPGPQAHIGRVHYSEWLAALPAERAPGDGECRW